MKREIKYIKTQDFYPTLCKWWDKQNFPKVSPSILPEYTAVCFNNKGAAVYSVCLYKTDSHLMWSGFPLTDPDIPKEEKKGCFKFLFDGAEKYAKELGYHVLFTTTMHKSVERVLIECGYNIGDEGVSHYLKTII